ncbi:MAG: hypothetical protein H0U60_08380 [Blastocatellia bacterium]|nr:hypothetical protein [Blastocatellia bacterium]
MTMLAVASVYYLWQVVAVRVQRPRAPFSYTQAFYLPEKENYCAGETVVYHYDRIVHTKDSVKIIAITLYLETGEDVWLQAQQFPLRGVAIGDINIANEASSTLDLSPDLKPGNYRLVHVSQSFESMAATFYVPFRIIDCLKAVS